MNTCSKCQGTGFVAVCVEPMAGLAGYESEPCGCEPVKRLPMPECPNCAGKGHCLPFGAQERALCPLCRGRGVLLLNDEPVTHAPTVSPLEAAWATRDASRYALQAAIARRDAAITATHEAKADFDAADLAALASGPRPATVPECAACTSDNHREARGPWNVHTCGKVSP